MCWEETGQCPGKSATIRTLLVLLIQYAVDVYLNMKSNLKNRSTDVLYVLIPSG